MIKKHRARHGAFLFTNPQQLNVEKIDFNIAYMGAYCALFKEKNQVIDTTLFRKAAGEFCLLSGLLKKKYPLPVSHLTVCSNITAILADNRFTDNDRSMLSILLNQVGVPTIDTIPLPVMQETIHPETAFLLEMAGHELPTSYWAALATGLYLQLAAGGMDYSLAYQFTHLAFYATHMGTRPIDTVLQDQYKALLQPILKSIQTLATANLRWDLLIETYLCFVYIGQQPAAIPALCNQLPSYNDPTRIYDGLTLTYGHDRQAFEAKIKETYPDNAPLPARLLDQVQNMGVYSLYHTSAVKAMLLAETM